MGKSSSSIRKKRSKYSSQVLFSSSVSNSSLLLRSFFFFFNKFVCISRFLCSVSCFSLATSIGLLKFLYFIRLLVKF
jgi:hypothetical protein